MIHWPHKASVDSEGNVYVGDVDGNPNVQRFLRYGEASCSGTGHAEVGSYRAANLGGPTPRPRRASLPADSWRLSCRRIAGTMLIVPLEHRDTDWTGVAPDRAPIERLTGASFAARLQRLSERAESLTTLRRALSEQRAHGEQLPRDPQPAPRPSR